MYKQQCNPTPSRKSAEGKKREELDKAVKRRRGKTQRTQWLELVEKGIGERKGS
jgi:hypothetical protein